MMEFIDDNIIGNIVKYLPLSARASLRQTCIRMCNIIDIPSVIDIIARAIHACRAGYADTLRRILDNDMHLVARCDDSIPRKLMRASARAPTPLCAQICAEYFNIRLPIRAQIMNHAIFVWPLDTLKLLYYVDYAQYSEIDQFARGKPFERIYVVTKWNCRNILRYLGSDQEITNLAQNALDRNAIREAGRRALFDVFSDIPAYYRYIFARTAIKYADIPEQFARDIIEIIRANLHSFLTRSIITSHRAMMWIMRASPCARMDETYIYVILRAAPGINMISGDKRVSIDTINIARKYLSPAIFAQFLTKYCSICNAKIGWRIIHHIANGIISLHSRAYIRAIVNHFNQMNMQQSRECTCASVRGPSYRRINQALINYAEYLIQKKS